MQAARTSFSSGLGSKKRNATGRICVGPYAIDLCGLPCHRDCSKKSTGIKRASFCTQSNCTLARYERNATPSAETRSCGRLTRSTMTRWSPATLIALGSISMVPTLGSSRSPTTVNQFRLALGSACAQQAQIKQTVAKAFFIAIPFLQRKRLLSAWQTLRLTS